MHHSGQFVGIYYDYYLLYNHLISIIILFLSKGFLIDLSGVGHKPQVSHDVFFPVVNYFYFNPVPGRFTDSC